MSKTRRLEPGKALRLQVQNPRDGNGSSWKIQTSKTTGDVYVAERAGPAIHSSFHHHGRWHYAIDSGFDDPDNPVRHLLITRHRQELAPGWTHAKRIVVPRSELRATVPRLGPPVVAVPIKWLHDAVALDVWLGQPGAGLRIHALPGVHVLAQMERGDGGIVLVISRSMDFPTGCGVRDAFAEEIVQARVDMIRKGWDGSPTRVALFGLDDNGFQVEYEIAIDPDP